MKFQPLEIYDLNLPDIPKRSRLYNLQAIGIGTPDVESLTGYIARLAQAHCMTTGELICSEIIPLLRPGDVFDSQNNSVYKSIICFAQSRTYNSTGLMANNLVDVLENLTSYKKLHFLTLLAFREVLYSRDLFRRFKAWCPICYTQQHIVYEPLIWSFNQITICPHHEILLQSKCPYCSRQMHFLDWNARPGYCSRCGKCLRVPLQTQNHILSDELLKRQLWVIESIGKLIAEAPNFTSIPKRKNIAKLMVNYLHQLSFGNQTAFARFCGINPGTIFDLFTGKSIPTLSKALQICFSLDIELLDFFQGKIYDLDDDMITKSLISSRQSNLEETKRCKKQPIGLCKIEQELLRALKEYPPSPLTDIKKRLGFKSTSVFYAYFPEFSHQISSNYAEYHKKNKHQQIDDVLSSIVSQDEYPPPSLTEISKRIGIGVRALYEHFPERCYEIAALHADYRHECKLQRQENVRQQVRYAALQLHGEGIKPSSGKITQLLNKPAIMLDRIAQITLHQVLCELGY